MKKRIKVGIVGFGYMGRFHYIKTKQMDSVDTIGIKEFDLSRAGVIIGLTSTMLMEALLCEKKVIRIITAADDNESVMSFENMGITCQCKQDYESILEALDMSSNMSLSKINSEYLLANYNYALDVSNFVKEVSL